MTYVTISTSISQIFLSWVAIFHLRQPMVRLSCSSYCIPGLAPLMSVLFREWRDFHVSFSGRGMSGKVWNCPSGSSMVDMGISSNIESLSPKFYMTFWDMIIYSDTLQWLDISLNRDLVTKLVWTLLTFLALLPYSRRFPKDICICSNVEAILSWTCHNNDSFLRTFSSFEHPSVLQFRFRGQKYAFWRSFRSLQKKLH